LLIPDIQHVPHREAPEQTLAAIDEFRARLLQDHLAAAR
jgi:hypothetical protein